MIPESFDYQRASSVSEAISLLQKAWRGRQNTGRRDTALFQP